MKAAYTLTVLLMCVLFTQISSQTFDDLTKNSWAFSNDNGFQGIVFFLPNGTIGNYVKSN